MAELNYLQMTWAVRPIVSPTYYDVTAVGAVPVISKIATLILEFNSNTVPLTWTNLTFGFTVWITGLYRLDQIPELSRYHSKQENHATFIYGFVPKPPKIDRVPVGRAIV
jgi:hypothetical protein